jgi:hypothetical protein
MLTVHRHIRDCTISTRPSDAHNWRSISITFTFADLCCVYIPSSAFPQIPSTETNLMLQAHRKENSSFLPVRGTESMLYSNLCDVVWVYEANTAVITHTHDTSLPLLSHLLLFLLQTPNYVLKVVGILHQLVCGSMRNLTQTAGIRNTTAYRRNDDHRIMKITNKMHYIDYFTLALHVSVDVFAHHQEYLTVFTVSGSIHPSCCRPVSRDTSRQQLGWTLPDTVNKVKCSWWWEKTSPETCRANVK